MATSTRESETAAKSPSARLPHDRPAPEAVEVAPPSVTAPQAAMLRLQRSHGNRYVQRLVAPARQAEGDREGKIAPEVEAAIERERGAGQALDPGVRHQMEPFFGADFGRVRIHTGSPADALNRALSARAFTTGQDIFFRGNEYNPESATGMTLLTHELTHVVQQGPGVPEKLVLGRADAEAEKEAERVSSTIASKLEDSQVRAPAATISRQEHPSTSAGAPTATKPQPEVSEEDRAEFALFGGKTQDKNALEYVQHREKFFGKGTAYADFAKESDDELAANIFIYAKLDLAKEGTEAQKVLYRWVRKAYINAGTKDVPAVIKEGASEELRDALAKVKKGYAKEFSSGGFNPRPIKEAPSYKYKLGTVSQHGTGTAIDIESGKNPTLSTSDWAFIEKLTGNSVTRTAARWKEKPKALWEDIKNLNDLFVAEVSKRVDEGKEKALPEDKKDPLDTVLAGHAGLKKWKGGFFTLEWELLEQLYSNGFTWGATFSNQVDLHHFEL